MTATYEGEGMTVTLDGTTFPISQLTVTRKPAPLDFAASLRRVTSGFFELEMKAQRAHAAIQLFIAAIERARDDEARRLAKRSVYNNRKGRSARRRMRRLVSPERARALRIEALMAYISRRVDRRIAKVTT